MSSHLVEHSPNLLEKVEETLEKEIASRHSYFQLKYFVIGKEPTTQAKMWQCLRELKSRYEALTSLDLEIEENQDNLSLVDIEIKKNKLKAASFEKDFKDVKDLLEIKTQENAIHTRKLQRKKKALFDKTKNLEEKKKYLLEETEFFLESFKNLEKVEKLKSFDDLEAQKQYWGTKLLEKINLKMLLQNPLDTELAETILALPDDIPVKQQMIKRLNTVQEQLAEIKQQYKTRIESVKGA